MGGCEPPLFRVAMMPEATIIMIVGKGPRSLSWPMTQPSCHTTEPVLLSFYYLFSLELSRPCILSFSSHRLPLSFRLRSSSIVCSFHCGSQKMTHVFTNRITHTKYIRTVPATIPFELVQREHIALCHWPNPMRLSPNFSSSLFYTLNILIIL